MDFFGIETKVGDYISFQYGVTKKPYVLRVLRVTGKTAMLSECGTFRIKHGKYINVTKLVEETGYASK